MAQRVRLVCEGETVEADLDVVLKSTVLKNMIEDTGCEGEIPIPNVQLATLRRVLEYCEHYRTAAPKEIARPLKSSDLLQHGVDEWDAEFIELARVDELIDLVVAANFLDVESLLNLGCAKIAAMVKNKSTEEIRELFNIKNDFTPEEESQLREENKWAEEAI